MVHQVAVEIIIYIVLIKSIICIFCIVNCCINKFCLFVLFVTPSLPYILNGWKKFQPMSFAPMWRQPVNRLPIHRVTTGYRTSQGFRTGKLLWVFETFPFDNCDKCSVTPSLPYSFLHRILHKIHVFIPCYISYFVLL